MTKEGKDECSYVHLWAFQEESVIEEGNAVPLTVQP